VRSDDVVLQVVASEVDSHVVLPVAVVLAAGPHLGAAALQRALALLIMLLSWDILCMRAKGKWCAAIQTRKYHTSMHPFIWKTRHRSARWRRFSALQQKSCVPSRTVDVYLRFRVTHSRCCADVYSKVQ
jgi:hypothetical protein